MKKFILFTFSILFSFTLFSQEICNNGIDDDGDGLIDLNDPDCTCTSSSTTPTSLIPNASFEDHSCCPSSWSQLNCADTWIQASSATSDYFNTCGWVPTIVPTPLPDGNGFCGAIFQDSWTEYVGACLTSPMIAGTQYQLTFYLGFVFATGTLTPCTSTNTLPPINLTLFGAQDCNNLPFATQSACPVGFGTWQELGYVTVDPYTYNNTWGQVTITFTPTVDIYAVVLGAPCTFPAGGNYDSNSCLPYFLYDDLVLNTSASFNPVSVTQAGNLCSNDLLLTASSAGAGTYQWYFGGEAIVGQTGTTLDVSALGYGAGEYQVVFTDVNGCSVASSIVDQQAVTITIDNTQNVSCNGLSDGAISISVSGGTSPYTYSWTGPGGYTSSSEDISSLAAGTYNLTVNDANSCSQTITPITITEPTSVSVTYTSQDETCVGYADGSIDLTVSGGTGPYTFSWTGPGGFTSANEDISGLSTGTYNVTVSDANNCQQTQSVTLSTSNIYSADFTVVTPICETGQTNISYTGNAPGGSTFTWDFGGLNIVSGTGSGPYVLNGTGGSTYTVSLVVDNSGCSSAPYTQDIQIDAQPTANAGPDDEVCGTAYTLAGSSPSAGSGLWTVSPSLTINNSSSAISTVTASSYGTYNFTWTITNGTCSDQDNVSITFDEQPVANAGSDDHICGNNYTLGATPSVGMGMWTVTPAGLSIIPPSNPTANAIANTYGSYTLTWTETNSICSDNASIVLTFDPVPTATFSATDIDCYGDLSTVSYTGNMTSSANYTWDFSGGNASPGTGQGPHTVSWTTANTYTISLTVDENGCTSNPYSVQVVQPAELVGTISSTDILCHGDNNGTVNINVSGGTPQLTFNWSNGSHNEDLVGLAGGNYVVTVVDANQCSISLAASVDEPEVLIGSIPSSLALCNGESHVIVPSVTGGTPPYTYTWDGVPYSNPTITVSPTTNTTMTFQVIDANNCTNSQQVSISVSPPLELNLFANRDSVCPGDPVIITGSLSGGAGGPYYSFVEGGQVVTLPFTYYPVNNGDIIVHVLDRCQSEAIDTVHVGLYPLPPLSFFSDITEGCQPLTVQFNEQSPNQGQTYLWDFGDNNNLSFAKNPIHVFEDAGTFDVTLTVTSSQGCTNTFTFEDMITVYPKPHAMFTTVPEVVTVLNTQVQFNNISTLNILNYWYFGDNDSSLVKSPVHTYPTYPGNYNVSLVAESQDGCLDTAFENIVVNDVITFWAPTAFSPDNDFSNDLFFVSGSGIDTLNFHLYVYDRWGEVVFETDKFNPYSHQSESWNGICKNHKVGENGVYTWLCTFNDIFGKAHEETGKINLIK